MMIWKKGRRLLEWRRRRERRFGNGAAQKLLEVLFDGRKGENMRITKASWMQRESETH